MLLRFYEMYKFKSKFVYSAIKVRGCLEKNLLILVQSLLLFDYTGSVLKNIAWVFRLRLDKVYPKQGFLFKKLKLLGAPIQARFIIFLRNFEHEVFVVIPTCLFAEYLFVLVYSVVVNKIEQSCFLSFVNTRPFHIYLISTD